MKLFCLVLVLFLFFPLSKAEVPPFQSMTVQWDHVSGTNFAIGYRIYTVDIFGITNYIGFTNGNRYSIQNITANPQRWFVTTTNLGNESDPCFPKPFRPSSPETTRQITTVIKTVVPGIIEKGNDILNFSESMLVSTVTTNGEQTITYKHFPNEPALFYKTKGIPPSARPPALPQ